jgi:hypothetical protein
VYTSSETHLSEQKVFGRTLWNSPRWYLHLVEGVFSRVKELACTNELESYAGGSLAAGRATDGAQVLSEVPDKKRRPGPPGSELGVRMTSSPHKTRLSRNPGMGEAMARRRTEAP